MARDLRLSISGDSSSGVRAIDKTADALDKANKELRQAEARTDALAVKARKLAEAEERAADKARDLAAKAAAMRKQIEESGDATGTLGKKLDRLTRDTKAAALATDDYRRAADRASAEAREQARAYDKVADNAREAARAVATLGAASALAPGGKGNRFGGALTDISGGFLKNGFGGASAALEGALGTPVVGPALLAAGAAAAIPAASFIGGAAGGGALAGIGAGAAGLGLAGAWMGDPEKYSVKWNASIDRIQKRWIDSSRAFGNELDGALKAADTTLRNLPIEKVLALSQSFVTPLAEGAGQGITAAANGIADALERVQPVVDEIGPEIANLGADFGDAFRIISQGSEGGAHALGDFINVVGYAVKAAGVMILGFEKAYENIRDFGIGVRDAIRYTQGIGPVFEGVTASIFNISNTSITAARTLADTGRASAGLGDTWLDMAKAGAQAALDTLALNDALTTLHETQLASADANLAVAQGWLDLNEELKDGAKTLDTTKQAGIDNNKVIIDTVGLLERQRQQAIETGGGTVEAVNAANAAYDAGIEKLRQAAYAAGFNKQQVDALITSLTGVPANTKANVEVPGLASALGQGIALGNALNNINGRYYYATVDVSYQGYNPGTALGNLLHHARGGEMPYSGLHVVGEHGPEVRFDSRGTYTATAEETRKLTSMMGGAAGPASAGSLTMKVAPGADSLFGQMMQHALDRGWVQIFAGSAQVTTRRG